MKEDLFQINSYTDDEKKKNASASQTIQFDKNGIKDLLAILKKEYPESNISKIKVNLLDNIWRASICPKLGTKS